MYSSIKQRLLLGDKVSQLLFLLCHFKDSCCFPSFYSISNFSMPRSVYSFITLEEYIVVVIGIRWLSLVIRWMSNLLCWICNFNLLYFFILFFFSWRWQCILLYGLVNFLLNRCFSIVPLSIKLVDAFIYQSFWFRHFVFDLPLPHVLFQTFHFLWKSPFFFHDCFSHIILWKSICTLNLSIISISFILNLSF
jgi:hypothetical protein